MPPLQWTSRRYRNLSAPPLDQEINTVVDELSDFLDRGSDGNGSVRALPGPGASVTEKIERVQQIGPAAKTLDLTRAVGDEFPSTIIELDWLERLYLYRGQLKKVPSAIRRLEKLRELSIARNQLQGLPSGIGDLTQLEILYLDHNQLAQLPETIGQLENLRELHLFANQLSQLPASFANLQNLQWLTLDSNQIEVFPAAVCELQNLRVLSLTDNRISTLPPEISRMTSLEKLYVGGNLIQRLPRELGDLPNLRIVDLDYHKLQFPPAGLIIGASANENLPMPTQTKEQRTMQMCRFLRICDRLDPLDLSFQAVVANRVPVELLPVPDLSRLRIQDSDWLDFAESVLEDTARTRANPLWEAWISATHRQTLTAIKSQLNP